MLLYVLFLFFTFLVSSAGWAPLGSFFCVPQIAVMVSEHLIISFPSFSSDNIYSWVNFNCKYLEALNSYANIALTGTILQ
jgi:purine-cytosine permease-like protein